MSDNEHDIPVKVVDRRWWANTEAATSEREGGSSLKPTYVEELEQKVVENANDLILESDGNWRALDLFTGDPEFESVEQLVKIEWLGRN